MSSSDESKLTFTSIIHIVDFVHACFHQGMRLAWYNSQSPALQRSHQMSNGQILAGGTEPPYLQPTFTNESGVFPKTTIWRDA